MIGSDHDITDMRIVRDVVLRAIAPFRSRIEAGVIAGALATIMREALDKYDATTRDCLMEGMKAYLDHRDVDAEQRAAAAGLVFPPKGSRPA